MRAPGAICLSATSLGELKNTIESRNALSISATATARTPSEQPIRTRRRCLRVIFASPHAGAQEPDAQEPGTQEPDYPPPKKQSPKKQSMQPAKMRRFFA